MTIIADNQLIAFFSLASTAANNGVLLHDLAHAMHQHQLLLITGALIRPRTLYCYCYALFFTTTTRYHYYYWGRLSVCI
ncbi:uncharacterized protein MYCFIDRAFT_202116 [Pseudocercospora fijiensis CIRAD86]|uniref:Uncharacterized protein n=1 Tax=Pseudocercospora fijiensis (strain CIRAD86) TaxID=383855 RepID=M2Z6J6_PSEFD|nr:uncharacterized protein MYCFIDRAFT_202116 [Pseudocercospora fijiensis CIRAD86]EME85395.1 hypothetical protein MYCFIDRAFT_202116 [Pseudocercospora fijiensis CIRAD86]